MNRIIKQIKAEAREQKIPIDFKKASKTEIYHNALFLLEGFNIPYHVSDRLFEIAEAIVQEQKQTDEYNNIRHGLWELENGVINLGEFMNGKELAAYLKNGG